MKNRLPIIILGIVFIIAVSSCGKAEPTVSDSTPEPTATLEPTAEQTMEPAGENQETNATQEQQTEKEQQEKETVWIVEEEEVRNNPIFVAFIDKEITAYDREDEKNLYVYEYFADYGRIDYVHYMAEDLNQDTKNELLVYIERAFGDLLVFEETESGELIAWEIWDYVTSDRQPDIYYCGNGTFMWYGGQGISVGHYTQEGTPEPLMDYYHTIKESNDTYYRAHIWLRSYENGKVAKEMEYECYYDTETDEAITELQSEEAREGERLADEILAALTEKKEVSIGGAEYRDEYKDKVKSVLLDELQSPDKIFYWGTEEYFNLLEGEWVAMEYAGTIYESGFDEAYEEWYQEEMQEYTNEIIEKYLGSEYRIEINNLVYFTPYDDFDLILEDYEELFFVTRFIPGEFVTITPPFIGLSARLADKNESYGFIIDADGTVLIEIEYCFFRLERR